MPDNLQKIFQKAALIQMQAEGWIEPRRNELKNQESSQFVPDDK